MTSYFDSSFFNAQNVNTTETSVSSNLEDVKTRGDKQATFVGRNAGNDNQGENVTSIGYDSLTRNSGDANVCFGYNSGNKILEGASNLFCGTESGRNNTNGNQNIFLGTEAGFLNTIGGNNIFIGNRAGYSYEVQNYNIIIGHNETDTSSSIGNSILLGHNIDTAQESNDTIIIGGDTQTSARLLRSLKTSDSLTEIKSSNYVNSCCNVEFNTDTVFFSNIRAEGGISSVSLDFDRDLLVNQNLTVKNNVDIDGTTTLNGDIVIPHPHTFTNPVHFESTTHFVDDVFFSQSPVFPESGLTIDVPVDITKKVTLSNLDVSHKTTVDILEVNTINLNNVDGSKGYMEDLEIKNIVIENATVDSSTYNDIDTNELVVNNNFISKDVSKFSGKAYFDSNVEIHGNLLLNTDFIIDKVVVNCNVTYPKVNEMDLLFTSNIESVNIQCESLKLPDLYEWNQNIKFAGDDVSFLNGVDFYGNLRFRGLENDFLNKVYFHGEITVNEYPMNIKAGANIFENLSIHSNATFHVNCPSTFNDKVSASNVVEILSNLSVNDNLNVNGNVFVEDDVSMDKNLYVNSNLTVKNQSKFFEESEFFSDVQFDEHVSFDKNPSFKHPFDVSDIRVSNLIVDESFIVSFCNLSFCNDVHFDNCSVNEIEIIDGQCEELFSHKFECKEAKITDVLIVPSELFVENIFIENVLNAQNANLSNTNASNLTVDVDTQVHNLVVKNVANFEDKLISSNAYLYKPVLASNPLCPDTLTGNDFSFSNGNLESLTSSNITCSNITSTSNAELSELQYKDAHGCNLTISSNIRAANIESDFITSSNEITLNNVLLQGSLRLGNDGSASFENKADFIKVQTETVVAQNDISVGRNLYTQNVYIKTKWSDVTWPVDGLGLRMPFFSDIDVQWGSPNMITMDSDNYRFKVNQDGIYDISVSLNDVNDKLRICESSNENIVSECRGGRFLETLTAGKFYFIESTSDSIKANYVTVYLVNSINKDYPFEPIQ